jgi:hypothetical protein
MSVTTSGGSEGGCEDALKQRAGPSKKHGQIQVGDPESDNQTGSGSFSLSHAHARAIRLLAQNVH